MVHGLLILFLFLVNLFTRPVANIPYSATIQKDMQITSSAFFDNTTLPKKYTCQGEGVNPPLSFVGVPTSTKSLALIVSDPDAPLGIFTHWVLFNIPPNTREIEENSHPVGAVISVTSAGKPGFVAVCPPRGTGVHHYVFKLYALDMVIVLTPNVGVVDVENAMQSHIVASAQLIGLYPPEK